MNDLCATFEQLGVVSTGHFLLSSGRHSAEYWEKFRLLEWPRITEQLCQRIAEMYAQSGVEAVVGPTIGGALLAQELARQLSTRCLLAEPAPAGGRELRRGFTLHSAERLLIVDDVLTTGLSLHETVEAVAPYRPNILGIAVLIDRSGGTALTQFPVACQALLSVQVPSYSPADCPLCAKNQPLTKPGTRDLPLD